MFHRPPRTIRRISPARTVRTLFAVAAVMLGLTSLGMRLPMLGGVQAHHSPKPTPRAIITAHYQQTTKKLCGDHVPAVTSAGVSPAAPAVRIADNRPADIRKAAPVQARDPRSGRAPPTA